MNGHIGLVAAPLDRQVETLSSLKPDAYKMYHLILMEKEAKRHIRRRKLTTSFGYMHCSQRVPNAVCQMEYG